PAAAGSRRRSTGRRTLPGRSNDSVVPWPWRRALSTQRRRWGQGKAQWFNPGSGEELAAARSPRCDEAGSKSSHAPPAIGMGSAGFYRREPPATAEPACACVSAGGVFWLATRGTNGTGRDRLAQPPGKPCRRLRQAGTRVDDVFVRVYPKVSSPTCA